MRPLAPGQQVNDFLSRIDVHLVPDMLVKVLRDPSRGVAELLAEICGILEGASEGRLDEPFARCAAELCRLAGADESLIPAWIEVGRRRAAAARMPPPRYS